MDEEQQTKIEDALKVWEESHKKKEKYTGHLLTGEKFVGHDIFEMGLAFDDEKRAWIHYQLAMAEAHNDMYHGKSVEYLRNEIKVLDKRIAAWKERQLPSQTK